MYRNKAMIEVARRCQRLNRARCLSSLLNPMPRPVSSLSKPEPIGSNNFAGWVLAAGSGLLTFSLIRESRSFLNNRALCEDPSSEPAEDEEEDDPYDNLPEEDEPTDCSMCNTFRKGPCRPFWRKLERCFKDHEGEEQGALKCMRYFKPHQTCIAGYSNLYQLVSLEMKQDLVEEAELAMEKKERRGWNPTVDWSTWIQFTKDAGKKFKETIRSKDPSTSKLLPLWQRLPENKEPVLVTVTSPLPKFEDEKGMVLKVAYAVDQDGFVLGLTYNKGYAALLAEAKANNGERGDQQEADEPAAEEDDPKAPFDFEFFIVPGETKSVQICGLYSESPVDADPEKDVLDALLYSSKKLNVKKAAK